MTKLELLAFWQNLASVAGGATLVPVWTEDDLFGYFDHFRPHGQGIEQVFEGVVGGAEIVDRMMPMFECTKESFGRDAYFMVRSPIPADANRMLHLTGHYLEKTKQITAEYCATAKGATDLFAFLDETIAIEVTREPYPQSPMPDYDAPETLLYDVVSDWFLNMQPIESDALLLKEAFYSIACDYKIARYLMWPLYRNATAIEDPFRPYFELWQHGARPYFGRPGRVTVHISGDNR